MISALIAFIQPLFSPSLPMFWASLLPEQQGLIRQRVLASVVYAPYTSERVRNLRIATLIHAEQRQLAQWERASWLSNGTYRTKGRPQ